MLENRWYAVLESDALKRKPIGIKRMGHELVLWRDAGGAPRLLPAACPHRGASLAGGRIVDGELECPWHGFRFAGDGRCTLAPCEGPDATVPKALHLRARLVREAHGLVWMWWGEEREVYPEIPFFDDRPDLGGSTQTSYILPYHYSRMVETNLDIHHTPFVHGNVIPCGTRMLDFDAHVEGDRIFSRGRLVKEARLAKGDDEGLPFRADLILPNLVLIELTPKLAILVCATPVDEGHSWLWFRYCQAYTKSAMLGKLITWISVQSELKIVQKQDWRIFAGMSSGTIDDFPYAFVHADKAIALYRKLRSEALAAQRETEARTDHGRTATHEHHAITAVR
jgi:phenylpropionate dioxygenase-like ring-hydroxylating dioxygenase large terminal subunit